MGELTGSNRLHRELEVLFVCLTRKKKKKKKEVRALQSMQK